MLSIVATPIGNLEDITLRALRTLQEADLVLCEDTRHSGKLLHHFQIKKPLRSFHAHSSDAVLQSIHQEFLQGKKLVYISDAGTPGISDPGYRLVRFCIEQGIQVEPIPGPSAFLTGLMASALPINHFLYLGFLPQKKGRKTLLERFVDMDDTLVFYESPYRIQKTLQELNALMPDRQLVVARELTKMHEEFVRGTVREVTATFAERKKILGEFVLILAPKNFS